MRTAAGMFARNCPINPAGLSGDASTEKPAVLSAWALSLARSSFQHTSRTTGMKSTYQNRIGIFDKCLGGSLSQTLKLFRSRLPVRRTRRNPNRDAARREFISCARHARFRWCRLAETDLLAVLRRDHFEHGSHFRECFFAGRHEGIAA